MWQGKFGSRHMVTDFPFDLAERFLGYLVLSLFEFFFATVLISISLRRTGVTLGWAQVRARAIRATIMMVLVQAIVIESWIRLEVR